MGTKVTTEEAIRMVKKEDVLEGTQLYAVRTTTPMVGYQRTLQQDFGYVASQGDSGNQNSIGVSEAENYGTEEGPISMQTWVEDESDDLLEPDKERSGSEAASEIEHLLDNNDVASIMKGGEDEYLVKVEMEQGSDIIYRVSQE